MTETYRLNAPLDGWGHRRPPTPFADYASGHIAAGWPVLFLPPKQKSPPPEGFTGHFDAAPTAKQIGTWAKANGGTGNLAGRLPDGVIGIDVDAYHGGLDTFAALKEQWGDLPSTWGIRNRDDGSITLLYQVRPGLTYPGKAGVGIEIIQHGHRYTVLPGSVHPEGRRYTWVDPSGGNDWHNIPSPDELAELPKVWADGLAKGAIEVLPRVSVNTDQWLEEFGAGEPDDRVKGVVLQAQEDFTDAGGRHDSAKDATFQLVCLAAEGHKGVGKAIGEVADAFINAVTADRSRTIASAKGEFERLVVGAVAIGAARPPKKASIGFRFYTARELAGDIEPVRFIVKGVLAEGTYGPIAGAKKSLKSYMLDDLGLAVASGNQYLGHFDVLKRGPVVAFISEGGRQPYQRRRNRLAAAMGIDRKYIGDLPIFTTFDVHNLDSEEFTDAVKRMLDEVQPVLITIDSLYGFHPSGIEAGNVYDRGPMLTRLSDLVGSEAALLVADHFNKTGDPKLDLDSIAQAGMAQWADSWVLQKHRETARPDTGDFKLLAEFGSRQWGGAQYEVDWHIGAFNHDTFTHDGELSREVRPANWGAGSRSSVVEDRASVILRIVDEEPWEHSFTTLAKRLGGNAKQARLDVQKVIDSGVIAERKIVVPDKAGKDRTLPRIGRSEPLKVPRPDVHRDVHETGAW